jgi:magnesium-transporting ATPase (P-type)
VANEEQNFTANEFERERERVRFLASAAEALSLTQGTMVTHGKGIGVVVATGDRTELGKMSHVIQVLSFALSLSLTAHTHTHSHPHTHTILFYIQSSADIHRRRRWKQ